MNIEYKHDSAFFKNCRSNRARKKQPKCCGDCPFKDFVKEAEEAYWSRRIGIAQVEKRQQDLLEKLNERPEQTDARVRAEGPRPGIRSVEYGCPSPEA